MTFRVNYFNMLGIPAPWWIKSLKLFTQLHPLTVIKDIHYCFGACAATDWMMARTRSRLM
jgi:hypothetical protein